MDRAQENAIEIAKWLKKQDIVGKVIYPGFEEHPGYEIILTFSRISNAYSFFVSSKVSIAPNPLACFFMITFLSSGASIVTITAVRYK